MKPDTQNTAGTDGETGLIEVKQVPAGPGSYVLVPREPTHEQLLAYLQWPERVEAYGELTAKIYRTMVAASPVTGDQFAAGLHADPGFVPLPRNAEEAKAMWLVGERWMRDNAPEQIRAPADPAPIAAALEAAATNGGGTLRQALDNSQSLLAMIDNLGPDAEAWGSEGVRDLLYEQVAENRAALNAPVADDAALSRAHAAGIIAADWTLFTHEQSLAIRQKYLPAVLAAVLREPGFGEGRHG